MANNSSAGKSSFRFPAAEYPLVSLTSLSSPLEKIPSKEELCRKTKFAVKYCLTAHHIEKQNPKAISTAISSSLDQSTYAKVLQLLKHYGVFDIEIRNKENSERRKFKYKKKTLKLVNSLVEQGLNQSQIRRQIGLGDTPLRKYLRKLGHVAKYEKRVETQWVVPSKLPANTAHTYNRYCHSIRHYSNIIFKEWKHILDPKDQRSKIDYHLDHKLSVYDGFNAGDVPVPWQLLCHPANFQIIKDTENYSKGRWSTINLKGLLKAIEKFEEQHSKVLLPVRNTKTGKTTYNLAKGKKVSIRVKQARKFTNKEIKEIAKTPRKIEKYASSKKKERTRLDYENVLYLIFGKGISNRKILRNKLGFHPMTSNLGIDLNTTLKERDLAKRLFKKEYSLSKISEKMNITKRRALLLLSIN